MLDLTRTVRFCLNDPDDHPVGARHNAFSAWPAMRGLGRYYELAVTCRGDADAVTGYFLNITHIDQAVREHALPYLERLVGDGGHTAAVPMGALLRRLLEVLGPPLHDTIIALTLVLSPRYRLGVETHDMHHAMLRQQYEFSAAHRLHVESLSDEENRRVFGKCNNPSGHGHNYQLEVAVRVPIDPQGRCLEVEALDALVDDAVVRKLDHKHLNVDVPVFAKLNPSVENIAMVIHGMLKERVGELDAELVEVSVWETGKTVCTYRGE
ncbi:MAG: 6-carboxytetrahydropterin synthase [Phycisphaeraceae bacterium]